MSLGSVIFVDFSASVNYISLFPDYNDLIVYYNNTTMCFLRIVNKKLMKIV